MTGNPEAENALRSILEKVEKQLTTLRTRKEKTYWKASLTGSENDFAAAEKVEIAYRMKLANQELFDELTGRLSDPGVQDLLIRRWATLMLLEIAPNRLPEETIRNLVVREKELENIVNSFRPEIAGETVTTNKIVEILRTSDDIALRKEAWEASKAIGPQLADKIRELVKARNLSARQLGFPDFYRMKLELQEIDEVRLFSSLGRFASLSEDAYRRQKARLDRLLADHFEIEAIDLTPWHYADPFFQEVPPVFGVNTDPFYQDKKTLEWTRKYFKKIGLPIDSILKKGDYYEKEGKDPHAFCLDVDRDGDVRVLLNLQDNAYWAGAALHEFGHAVYNLNTDKSLPYTLRQPAHIAASEGVAMFFGRLARDTEWMVDQFGLSGEQIREIERPLLEEQRMQMAVTGRWMLVMIHFERGLYRDPDYDQQSRWWDLVQRFQLIRRPPERKDDQDWAAKLHISIAPVYYHNYLLGEWLASQYHFALMRDLKLNPPVVWADNKGIGSWFKEKLFRHGAMWGLNELTRNATGSVPQPDAFVTQYFR